MANTKNFPVEPGSRLLRRWTWGLSCGLSAIGFVLTVILCVRTFFFSDHIDTHVAGHQINIETFAAQVEINIDDAWCLDSSWHTDATPPRFKIASAGFRHNFLGLAGEGHAGVGPMGMYASDDLIIPAWFPLLVFATLPITWLYYRHRRSSRGFPVAVSSPASAENPLIH